MYHRLKELQLQNLSIFNYQALIQQIVNKDKLIAVKYYIGAIRAKEGNPKGKRLRKNQRRFLGNLQKQGFEIGFGHMLKTDKYHEKGVDVLLAADMLIGAYEDLYDKIILISSDTDLLPAINKTKELGKTVEYIGFSHKPSHAMIANCSSSFLLRKQDLERFL